MTTLISKHEAEYIAKKDESVKRSEYEYPRNVFGVEFSGFDIQIMIYTDCQSKIGSKAFYRMML